jgi:hypothetical protein
MNAGTNQDTTHNSNELQPACTHCRNPLQPHIMYGDMHYYVCRACGTWAVPYPPPSTVKVSAWVGSAP